MLFRFPRSIADRLDTAPGSHASTHFNKYTSIIQYLSAQIFFGQKSADFERGSVNMKILNLYIIVFEIL